MRPIRWFEFTVIRGPVRRLFALASAAPFLLAVGPGSYGGSECLHHLGRSDTQEAAYEPRGTRHWIPSAGSERHGAGHLPHTEDESAPIPCTCVGSCVIAPKMAAPPPQSTLAGQVPTSERTAMPGPGSLAQGIRTAYLLPYPKGPPLRS